VKRNSIYLRSNLSEKELILLKKDLIDNSIYFVLKIKNLIMPKEQIENIARNAVECVINAYKFGQDGSLGDLVKTNVVANLRAYYENTYPDQANKVIWPDLDKRKPFEKLLEVLEKVKLLPDEMIQGISFDLFNKLNERQQKLVSTMYRDSSINYAEISKKFGKRGVMTYKQIKIIYDELTKILKDLGVNI
jgi:hypothetical protein